MIKSKTESKATRRKLEIQTLAEKILKKHNLDYTKDFYLKLSMPPYQDLTMGREDDIIIIGHYRKENGDTISDPVLVFSYNQGEWLPLGIEQELGDTICAYFENGKRIVYEDRIEEFRAFQKTFAKNIREQGYLENGLRVQSGLVCGVMFIEKGSPNPMRDLSEYSKPNEQERDSYEKT